MIPVMVAIIDEPAPGQVLQGAHQSWKIGDRVAAGGTSVIRAVTGQNGRAGVIKVPSAHRFAADDAMQARHRRELKLLQTVTHRNVLPILDLLEMGGSVVAVFERAESSVHQITSERRIGTSMAFTWLQEVASGLAAIHSAGIVHRDITPKNLLLMHDGRLCVGDLGAARAVGDETITRVGDQLGSLVYVSREQAREPHSAEPSDDVFSLGQVGYLLLTGRRPQGNPPPLVEARPGLPSEVTSAIESMRADERRCRPRNGAAAIRCLDFSVETWLRIAGGLIKERYFEEGLQALRVVSRLYGRENPSDIDLIDLAWDELVVRDDPTVGLRFARWAADRLPSGATTNILAEATVEYKRLVVTHPMSITLQMPFDSAALERALDQHWQIFQQFISTAHQGCFWIKMQHRAFGLFGRREITLGLAQFGLESVRSSLIVVESLLGLEWAFRAEAHWDERVALLPSRWCSPFDELDETLLAVAARDDKTDAFRDNLEFDTDGKALWDRWERRMRSLCTCELIGARVDDYIERPDVQRRDDCGLVRLIETVSTSLDFATWVAHWQEHPELSKIDYVAKAADIGRALASV